MTNDALELVGLPEGGPTTVPAVKVWLDIPEDDTTDDTTLELVVDSVNSQVRTWRVSQAAVADPPAESWPPRIVQGSTMLAARLFRRKNSPAGVEAFSTDGAVYVQRNDPDVGMLLGLGTHQPPTIG